MKVSREEINDALACLARMPPHPWERIGGLQLLPDGSMDGYRLEFRCMSCGSSKYQNFDLYGRSIGSPYYVYSQAFQQVKRPDESDEFTRVEMFRAAFIKQNKPPARRKVS